MGSIEIIENGKRYSPELDLWIDGVGREYVKNEFHLDAPVFIDVSRQRWTFPDSGNHFIDWGKLSLPNSLEKAFQFVVKKKMKFSSAAYIAKCRLMLAELKGGLKPRQRKLSDLRMPDMVLIWSSMTIGYRPFFRELYATLVAYEIEGASFAIAKKMDGMKARSETRILKDVLNWHPLKGALTQEEETLLRNNIERSDPPDEPVDDLGKRLFCWLLISTLKRSKQIRELKANCLKTVENNNTVEYFVLVKPVKAQTGDPERWWSIQEALYNEMLRYSSNPRVKNLQLRHDCFWVHQCPSLDRYGSLGAADAKSLLQGYVKTTLAINSPRTGERLHITPTRLRHTGGTRLAFKGVPRDIISEILEHDSKESCQAYIDAVGSELCPSMDRADRNMGSLFMELNKAYFDGVVVDELRDQPIVIPDFTETDANPLFVGSCGRDTCKEGACKKHPFVGCYNGCSSFLAWREADHKRALAFADKELERWREAIGNPDQASTIKEYEELRNNIKVVIDRISDIEGGA